MNRQQKIEKIYEEIWWFTYYEYIRDWHSFHWESVRVTVCMIWDILEWYNKKYWHICEMHVSTKGEFWVLEQDDEYNSYRISCLRNEFTKPIEEQSDECIDFIFWLITND